MHGYTQYGRTLGLMIGLALAGALAPVGAQSVPDINAPKRAAQKAADSTNARLSAQTGQAMPARRGAAAPQSGPGSAGATSVAPAGPSAVVPGEMVPVTREVFGYGADGRRDPFYSLILTEDLRPLLSDLRLVGIVYEPSGRRSVAVMRDVLTNAQYRVNTGMTLGRMRVAQIKPKAVIFTIDEFGVNRQDSLFMSDSTKVRNP